MPRLWLYDRVSRLSWLNYRGKIMLMAFVGTHIPLLAIIGLFVAENAADLRTALTVSGVALVATLVGTGITLYVLNALLQPILITSAGLRGYRTHRRLPSLPTSYRDEAGTLMADAEGTLRDLDAAIEELAFFDKTTGLPNRSKLIDQLNLRIDRAEPFALCSVRLGNFERLITTFGHATAGAAMRHLAGRLRAALPAGVTAGRVTEDSFAFILAAGDGSQVVTDTTDALLKSLGREFPIDDVSILPEVSAGASFYPDDATDPEALLNNAATAQDDARSSKTPGIAFFSVASREAAQARFLTEQELRRALINDEFRLHFQPVVDMTAGRAVGAEALIRWQHPDRGLVPPGMFIPVAEASGLIDPIDQWVLRAACAQLKTWSSDGIDGVRLAVNLSGRAFNDPDLITRIRESLDDNHVSPDRLEIELTETAAMRDQSRTRDTFVRLRDLGVHVAIDDFGTGYSSMSYLKNLPFDKLKIDREFVSNVDTTPSARAICGALVELARGLGIGVLAEGAETEDEVRTLHKLGCRLFQGFYFARPQSPDQFADTVTGLALTLRIMQAAGDTTPGAATAGPARDSNAA